MSNRLGHSWIVLICLSLVLSSVVYPQQESNRLKARGHFGGYLSSITHDTQFPNYLFTGEGNGINIYNVSNLSDIQPIESYTTSGTDVTELVIRGKNAFAVNGHNLLILDITDPTNVSLQSETELDQRANGLAVRHGYAVITFSDSSVSIFDVRNVNAPQLLASIELAGPAMDVKLGENYAFIAAGSQGMLVVDIHDKANPAVQSQHTTLGIAQRIGVAGNAACVASTFSGLNIFDISDIDNITRQSTYPGDIQDVAFVGSTAFIADRSEGLKILDISTLTLPVLLGTAGNSSQPTRIAVGEDKAFLGCPETGVYVYDTSSLSNPFEADSYIRPSFLGDIAINQSILYTSDGQSLWAFDIDNPAVPTPVSSIGLKHPFMDQFMPILLDQPDSGGNFIYIGEANKGIEIFRVDDPTGMISVAEIRLSGGQQIKDLVIENNKLYVLTGATDNSTLFCYDIRNPESAQEIYSYTVSGSAHSLCVNNQVCYIANETNGLGVLDVSGALPQSLAPLNPPIAQAQTHVLYLYNDQYLLVGSNDSPDKNGRWWLEKIDISDPANPISVDSYQSNGYLNDIDGYGSHAYLAVDGGTLYSMELNNYKMDGYVHMDYTSSVKTTKTEEDSIIFTTSKSYGGTSVSAALSEGCGLFGKVAPTPEAGIISPISYPCDCGDQTPVDFTAEANEGWQFIDFSPETPHTCPEEGTATITANFQPVLTIGGGKETLLCAREKQENELILPFSLTASVADDWQVTSFTFSTTGTGDDQKDISAVRLYHGNKKLDQTKQFEKDDGEIRFSFDTILLPKNQPVNFSLVCDFIKQDECPDSLLDYEITLAGLEAMAIKYPPGVRIGGARAVVKKGCVINVNKLLSYTGIQDAVDNATANDTIVVCPGTYEENIDINKPMTIRSLNGSAETYISAASANDHVFHITSENTIIKGFTIENASGETKAGVYVAPEAMNSKIMNNVFFDNYYGIYLDRVEDIKVKDNKVMDSKAHGLFAFGAIRNEITQNSFSQNDSSGVFMSFCLETGYGEGTFTHNHFRANQQHGIVLSDCQGITLKNQASITENKLDGIYLQRCNRVRIEHTPLIKENNRHGIHINSCHEIDVSGNTLESNTEYGIAVVNCILSGTENPIQIRGNTFSGSTRDGLQKMGVYLENSTRVKIGDPEQKNTFLSHPQYGICLTKQSNENEIQGNIFKYNMFGGVYLNQSQDNRIVGANTIGPENGHGVHVDSCFAMNEIYNAEIKNNLKSGILVERSSHTVIGDSTKQNIIQNNKANGVVLLACQNNNMNQANIISGNKISENDSSGIAIIQSQYNIVRNHKHLKNNKLHGIYQRASVDYLIENNKCLENRRSGISLLYCSRGLIKNNELKNNDRAGLAITSSNKYQRTTIDIVGNTMRENKNGIEIDDSNSIYVYKGTDTKNVIVLNDSCGIKMSNCLCSEETMNVIMSNSIQGNDYGIVLDECVYTRIGKENKPNLIESNLEAGIVLYRSKINKICYNQIGPKNVIGVVVDQCFCWDTGPNEIYANSIFKSTRYGIQMSHSTGNRIGLVGHPHNDIYENGFDGIILLHCNPEDDEYPNIVENNTIQAISSLDASGISLYNCSKNSIRKNSTQYASLDGIHLELCSEIDIYENDPVSENWRHGIYISESNNIKLWGNVVTKNAKNGIHLHRSHENMIPPKKKAVNSVTQNEQNGIYLQRSHDNAFYLNQVHHNNQDGMYFFKCLNNTVHGKQQINHNQRHGIVLDTSTKNSIIGEEALAPTSIYLQSESGWNAENGIYMKYANGNTIKYYEIRSNETGVFFEGSINNIFIKCLISRNSTAVAGNDGNQNKFIDCHTGGNSGITTGFRLNNCNPEIIGCTINDDMGDGIKCTNGSNPVIKKCNIYNNKGFGINNLDETITIDATDNWWGASDGPAGNGNGSGDEVSTHVDFTSWRTDSVSTVVYAAEDTTFTGRGIQDSVLCVFRGVDRLEVNISDSLNWLTGPKQIDVDLTETPDLNIQYKVPANTQIGSINKVKIRITSATTAGTDIDSFYIAAYQSIPEWLEIRPDSVVMRPGATQQFYADVYDSLGTKLPANISWSATGGTIDTNGLFVADSTVGQYQVIAQETLAHRADTATVQIFAPLAQIHVRPDSVQLAPNETQQFTAQGYDAWGNTVPAFVRWSATGGTVTVSGLYTAGSDSGLYVIQAVDTLASIRGWANVRIVSITRVDDKVQIPEEFFLSQNFPNPFNPTTTIKFGVKKSGHVRLSVFDIRGRWVATLLDDHLQEGRYDIRFDASALASGLYFYRLETRTFSETKKMILLE